MIGMIMSYFDMLSGPALLMKIPNTYPQGVDHIPFLMDFYEDGFFIHEFGELKSANLIFEIPSPIARGEKEIAMISIVSYQEVYNINLYSFRDILEYFAQELINLPNAYKGFHYKDDAEGTKVFKKISDIMFVFYDSIPKHFDQHFTKIVTYELSDSGKSLIIDELKEKLVKPKNSIGEYKVSNPLTSL